ncbi:MAG TPA: VanZ family protein [Candidatus Gemmiger faecigallinarum]|nr:VanZ family protein [Candidatus Gemmiger faecigallinarum]
MPAPDRSRRKGRICGGLLFAAYLAVLLRITVFRSGAGSAPLMSGSWNGSLFTAYLPLLQQGDWLRIVYLFGGNLCWFVPLGWALRRWTGRLWPAVLCGFALSLAIEAGQYLLGTGQSELDDLVLNTAGALLGAGLAALWGKLARRKGGETPRT